MAWLGQKLHFQIPEDWYKITAKDFYRHKGHTLLKYYQHSPSVAVMDYLPNHDWQPEKFSERKKRQKRLYQIVKRIFSEYGVQWDFKHREMRFKHTNRSMELDIFIPELQLAIEYQGEQHVFPREIWGGIRALQERQEKDEEKRQACQAHEITLIEVCYTWDGSEETAIAILSQQFILKVKERMHGTERIQAALKAINVYCKKKQRKQPKRNPANQQENFDFGN